MGSERGWRKCGRDLGKKCMWVLGESQRARDCYKKLIRAYHIFTFAVESVWTSNIHTRTEMLRFLQNWSGSGCDLANEQGNTRMAYIYPSPGTILLRRATQVA